MKYEIDERGLVLDNPQALDFVQYEALLETVGNARVRQTWAFYDAHYLARDVLGQDYWQLVDEDDRDNIAKRLTTIRRWPREARGHKRNGRMVSMSIYEAATLPERGAPPDVELPLLDKMGQALMDAYTAQTSLDIDGMKERAITSREDIRWAKRYIMWLYGWENAPHPDTRDTPAPTAPAEPPITPPAIPQAESAEPSGNPGALEADDDPQAVAGRLLTRRTKNAKLLAGILMQYQDAETLAALADEIRARLTAQAG